MNIVGINSSQRYDADDEGFSDDEHEPVIIIEKKDDILNIDNRFAKIPGNKQS